jgi:hypothetical protein
LKTLASEKSGAVLFCSIFSQKTATGLQRGQNDKPRNNAIPIFTHFLGAKWGIEDFGPKRAIFFKIFITLLSPHGYKGQRKTNNHTERGA